MKDFKRVKEYIKECERDAQGILPIKTEGDNVMSIMSYSDATHYTFYIKKDDKIRVTIDRVHEEYIETEDVLSMGIKNTDDGFRIHFKTPERNYSLLLKYEKEIER